MNAEIPSHLRLKVASWFETCVACGQKFHPKYLVNKFTVKDGFVGPLQCIEVSDHHCDPKRLKRREEELRHEWDDDEPYCECDDLDCKFEFIEQMKNEMQ